jgi:hypothetical protein
MLDRAVNRLSQQELERHLWPTALRAALKPETVRGSNLGHQVLIRLGSQVMIPGKIMQRMRPNIMSKTNGIDDL